jgi:glyoxylase-like metal-dependent hydrolase (beta-lactamase superfamily II)
VHLPPLRAAGQVELVDCEVEVLPGLRVIPAPGHTPGHICIALSSQGQQAIFAADVVAHESNFEHPEWMTAFESDPAVALATRRRIYALAADNRSLFIAFHLFSAGHVVRTGQGYRFQSKEVTVRSR